MITLGIHDGHNASVCFLKDGEIAYASQEERHVGKKGFFGFPTQALRFGLDKLKISSLDIDIICLASHYVGSPRPPKQIKYDMEKKNRGDIFTKLKVNIVNSGIYRGYATASRKRERLMALEQAGVNAKNHTFYEHHLCHASTAYYGLAEDNQKKYLVITLDGAGDMLCSTVSVGSNGKIHRVAATHQDSSLGELYALVTHLLGFMPLEHEYKLMGMAGYANEKHFIEIKNEFYKFLNLDKENPLKFSTQVSSGISYLGEKLDALFKHKRFDNICGALQKFSEELVACWVKNCVQKTGISDLLLAGGAFMNVKMNKIISEIKEVTSLQVFPSCGDETLSIGAAYLGSSSLNVRPVPLQHYYLGDAFSDVEILEALLKLDDIKYEKVPNINFRVAELLSRGEIVARCSGHMEFGARALGNRSILSDAANQDSVRIINKMVKKRDFWMPFAPAMRVENATKYLVNPKKVASPYMMMTYDTREETRGDMVAAVHSADLTARAQMVSSTQNSEFYNLLQEFEKLTGRGVVLNTSFNLHGLPMVNKPKEATYVFMNSGLKYMQLGSYLVEKNAK